MLYYVLTGQWERHVYCTLHSKMNRNVTLTDHSPAVDPGGRDKVTEQHIQTRIIYATLPFLCPYLRGMTSKLTMA